MLLPPGSGTSSQVDEHLVSVSKIPQVLTIMFSLCILVHTLSLPEVHGCGLTLSPKTSGLQ